MKKIFVLFFVFTSISSFAEQCPKVKVINAVGMGCQNCRDSWYERPENNFKKSLAKKGYIIVDTEEEADLLASQKSVTIKNAKGKEIDELTITLTDKLSGSIVEEHKTFYKFTVDLLFISPRLVIPATRKVVEKFSGCINQ